MKKYFFISILLLFTTATFAQPGKKQTRPPATQSGIDKIMEEALSDLSPEERKMAKEAMQMGKEMQQKGMTGNITSGEVTIPKKQVQLLSNIPSLTSQQQYNTYISNLLTECKKNIQPAI